MCVLHRSILGSRMKAAVVLLALLLAGTFILNAHSAAVPDAEVSLVVRAFPEEHFSQGEIEWVYRGRWGGGGGVGGNRDIHVSLLPTSCLWLYTLVLPFQSNEPLALVAR